MRCLSPWYNRTGWLGVKHQLTYILLLSNFEIFFLPQKTKPNIIRLHNYYRIAKHYYHIWVDSENSRRFQLLYISRPIHYNRRRWQKRCVEHSRWPGRRDVEMCIFNGNEFQRQKSPTTRWGSVTSPVRWRLPVLGASLLSLSIACPVTAPPVLSLGRFCNNITVTDTWQSDV